MNTTQYDHRASTSAHLASIGIATPDFAIDQQQAADFLLHHYADKLSARNRKIIEKIFAHPGVRKRKLALENLESLIDEGPDRYSPYRCSPPKPLFLLKKSRSWQVHL